MNIKRIKQRFQLSFMRALGNIDSISQEERYSMIIMKKLLEDKSNELLMHPTMKKKYVKSGNGNIFVVLDIDKSDISIVNHKYFYNVKLTGRSLNDLEKWFNEEMEARRQAMESEFMSNIQHSLKIISNQIGNCLPGID